LAILPLPLSFTFSSRLPSLIHFKQLSSFVTGTE